MQRGIGRSVAIDQSVSFAELGQVQGIDHAIAVVVQGTVEQRIG